MSRSSRRVGSTSILALALTGCAEGPIVAPLHYESAHLAPDEAFRARAPAWSPTLPALALPFDITSLSNGLTVVHVPRRGLPNVSIRLVITRGRADVWAPIDTAEILEKVLASGTQRRSESELAEAYGRLGADHGVVCLPDGCALSADIGAADLDAALSLVAETAIQPRFVPIELAVLSSRWMSEHVNSQHSAAASLARNAMVLLFGRAHPYGFAAFPSYHTRDLTVKDVAALHAQLFRPTHATLVVVGDVTKEAVAASATRWLSGWTSGTSPPSSRPPLQAPEVSTRRVVIVNHGDVRQSSAWVGVAVATADPADLAAVAVFVRSVGGLSSVLREVVRDASGAAYAFNDVNEPLRGVTVAGFAGELDREKAEEAVKTIVFAIRKARTAGVPAGAVALAQTNLIAEWQARASTTRGLSDLTAEALERGVAPDDLAAWPARLAAVTPAAVQRAAQRYFSDASLRVVAVGDLRWLKDLNDLGLGDYQLRDGFAEAVP
jgi:zinc protease